MCERVVTVRGRLREISGEVGGDFAESVEDDGGLLERNHVVHGANECRQVVVEFGYHDVGRDPDSPKRAKVAANHGRCAYREAEAGLVPAHPAPTLPGQLRKTTSSSASSGASRRPSRRPPEAVPCPQ